VDLVDSSGVIRQSFGRVRSLGGRYLTWLNTASALGAVGDTLVVVDLNNAVLLRYARVGVDTHFVLLDTILLPRYFSPRAPTESSRHAPELSGQEVFVFSVERQLAAAAVDGEGRVYAIRNLSYTDVPGHGPRIDQALEIYSARGALLGTFRLPIEHVAWLRVDGAGRIMLRGQEGRSAVIVVVVDPVRKTTCRGPHFRTEISSNSP
jgi:hypothetical protein